MLFGLVGKATQRIFLRTLRSLWKDTGVARVVHVEWYIEQGTIPIFDFPGGILGEINGIRIRDHFESRLEIK